MPGKARLETYYLTKCSRKLHENEEILAGGRVHGAPLNLPLRLFQFKFSVNWKSPARN